MQTNHETLIDWCHLKAMTGDQVSLACEIMQMFLDELQTLTQLIQTSFAQADWDTLAEHVHRLHGSCAYCGAVELSRLSDQLEVFLREQDFEVVPSLVESLRAHMQQILVTIDQKDVVHAFS